MAADLLPDTRDIRGAFEEEIAACGGRVSDAYDDGLRLFLRSVVPMREDVRPGDPVNGGVALRLAADEVLVHPYVFRQVCKNGAIMAEAMQTRRVRRLDAFEAAGTGAGEEAIAELREAVRECAGFEAFSHSAKKMRSAAEIEATQVINLMPFLGKLPAPMRAAILQNISHEFERAGDRTAFGMMNAVTAVARETRDPEVRWRLEELGGAVPAMLRPVPRRGRPGVLVGV